MVTLSISSGSGSPGDFISLTVSIASTGGDECVGIEFDILHSSELMLQSVTEGAIIAAAGKTLFQMGNVFIVSTPPLNVNVIADGVLITLNFQIDPMAPSPAVYPVAPSDVRASDADANPLTIARVPGAVSVGSSPSDPLTIGCPIANTAVVGVAYSGAFPLAGGTPPYDVTIIVGSLPPGVVVGPLTGILSGTPISPGMYPFTAQVEDSLGAIATT